MGQRTFSYITFIMVIARLVRVHAEPSIDSQPTCSSGKLDLVLVVDVSGSVEHKFLANRAAALEIARGLPIGWEKVMVAVIQYSRLAIMKLQFSSSETSETVNEAIMTLDWTGDVAFGAEAMDLAMIQFRRSRSDADRVIILFSDGSSLNSWPDVQATAERLQYSKAKIFAVTVSGTPYEPELKAYIGRSNGTIITTLSDLETLKKELLDYTVPACRSRGAPSLASKLESKNVEDSDDRSSKDTDDSNNHTAMHGKATTRTHRGRNSTASKRKHTSPPASNGTATTFPKNSTATSGGTKATPKTTKKAKGNHTKGTHTATPTAAATATATATDATTPKTATTRHTTDFFDPAARREAIEKMIDKATR